MSDVIMVGLDLAKNVFQLHGRRRRGGWCCPRGPSSAATRGLGLLAHVLVSKYGDHLPLCRQSQSYSREGPDLDR